MPGNVGQIERKTQQRVVKLFRERLGYDYLGAWTEREGNATEGLRYRANDGLHTVQRNHQFAAFIFALTLPPRNRSGSATCFARSVGSEYQATMNKCPLQLPTAAFILLLSSTLQLAHAQPADAPASEPNLPPPNEIVTVAVQDYTVSGLVTRLRAPKAFKYGIALFPGHPGIMKLHEENGQPRFELRGNFLVRSRDHWLDDETLVLVVDAPSDQWATFLQGFRENPRYGADVAALLNETARRYDVQDWTLAGTSEGSISAFHAARMNPGLARRVILTSSVFQPSRNGPGLSWVNWEDLKAPLLWVHHEDDPCMYTSYRDAQRFAEKSRSPLVTVRGGGPGRGAACMAFTAHGFVGVESETVAAMRSWVKTGAVPRDVAR